MLFERGSAQLTEHAEAILAPLVNELRQYGKDRVEFEGHTCDLGGKEENLALSERRAFAVKEHLVQQGISSERISVEVYGESQPAVPNNSEANRRLNRRVVTRYTIVN